MSWHADPAELRAYAAGTLDDARAYSVEAHVLDCQTCRTGLAVDPDRLASMWHSIAEVVDTPARSPVEGALVWLGVREHVARLLAATPSLRLSWLGSQALVLAMAAAGITWRRGRIPEVPAELLFLMVAAILPVIGIAIAYGPRVDPTYEVGLASPMPSFRLLMTRALAVLATSTVLAACASLAIPDLPWVSAAWILPSIGLAAATLAVSSFGRPLIASVAVIIAWLVVASAVAGGSADGLAMFRVPSQLVFVLLIGVSAAVLAVRRGSFEQEASP